MWFYENHMVLNPGKCHYLIINKDIANESIELGKKTLHAEAKQKRLGVIVDKDLKFQNPAKFILKIANEELGALIKAAAFMTDFNRKVKSDSLLKASLIIVTYSSCLALEL